MSDVIELSDNEIVERFQFMSRAHVVLGVRGEFPSATMRDNLYKFASVLAFHEKRGYITNKQHKMLTTIGDKILRNLWPDDYENDPKQVKNYAPAPRLTLVHNEKDAES